VQVSLEEILSPEKYDLFSKTPGEGVEDAQAAAKIAEGVLQLLNGWS
jgi:hypothetical protein